MIPAPFEYAAPKTLEEALRLVERHGDEAKILAGGHSLLPLIKLRLAQPRYVIDIGRLRGMRYIREENGHIAIGALTTHADIASSELLRSKCPLLPETAAAIGDVQVRNRGTLGGSLAHADPAADYPASVLALDVEIIAASTSGTRTIPVTEFFIDMLTTALRPGEILSHVRIAPLPPQTGTAYEKLHQPASGFAIVGSAVRLTLGKGNTIDNVAVGITGLGPKAVRASGVEKALRGKQASEKLFAEAAGQAAQGIDPLSDLHASGDYRQEMAIVYTRRALARAFARSRQSMKLSGQYTLPAPPAKVWELLTDPERLAKLLPGCERLEPDGPDRFKAAVKFGIAAISGKYAGTIEFSEKKPPKSMDMKLSGKGLPGFVEGTGHIELAEKGGQTDLRYTGEAQVGGMIAAVGQRMIEGAAKKIVDQFFAAAAEELKKG